MLAVVKRCILSYVEWDFHGSWHTTKPIVKALIQEKYQEEILEESNHLLEKPQKTQFLAKKRLALKVE